MSWAYYVGDGHLHPTARASKPAEASDTPADAEPAARGSRRCDETDQFDNIQTHADFFDAAADGTLPSVSWVMPDAGRERAPGAGGAGLGRARRT